ncbi:unnamed protein product [Rotaria sp. Silwood2]|nr:unnamed protein product [Rotaria sp. Silwood2]CAF2974017.1 unnamed protein product [Rotaria sp. Silwood2]CAF4018812.1 unnamed protein product [Rotaria sp. Silwood2]CAF4095808.1 unnamed protein product [Rotaria sp. Silwood2]
MNYPAATNNLYQVPKPVNRWEKIARIQEFLGTMWDFFFGWPMMILNKLGISLNFFSVNPAVCSILICGALIGITSSVGIGLGVGLSVGLNCAKSTSTPMNTTNTTNTTNIPNSNGIIG